MYLQRALMMPVSWHIDTSDICAIKRCRMSTGILFIGDICNHQDTHLLKSKVYCYTPFSMLYDYNWPRKKHSSIATWRKWRIAIRTLCNESKVKVLAPLIQWTLNDNKYIASQKWFLSCDLQTLHYREHETWWKYTCTSNRTRSRRLCIVFQTDKKLVYQRPYISQVCKIILNIRSLIHIQMEATELNFPPAPSGPHL